MGFAGGNISKKCLEFVWKCLLWGGPYLYKIIENKLLCNNYDIVIFE